MSRAFDTAYADGGVPTWDLGRPQPAVARLVAEGAFGAPGTSILDAGCGTGEHALLLASRGHRVVGVDLAGEAIRRARAKAAGPAGGSAPPAAGPSSAGRGAGEGSPPEGGPPAVRGTPVPRPAPTFLVRDALDLAGLGPFDAALDVGLFHVLDDAERPRYAASLAAVVRPGGRAFVLCWSDRNPFGRGPRRVTRRELRRTFGAAAGWRVDRIDAEELVSRLPGGRVDAWLARLTRRP